jgi:DNA-binding transcriptional LysR family regulator
VLAFDVTQVTQALVVRIAARLLSLRFTGSERTVRATRTAAKVLVKLDIVAETNSHIGIPRMVEAGVGVGFVLKHAVLEELPAKVGAGRTERVPAGKHWLPGCLYSHR